MRGDDAWGMMKRRRHAGRWARTAALLLVVAGCSRLGSAPRHTLAACSLPGVDTTEWVRQAGPYRGFTFLLPPAFQRDTAGWFMHGGTAWRDGPRRFEQVNGYWSPASFRGSYADEPPRDAEYSECWDTIGGLRVFLSTRYADGRYAAGAWFTDPGRHAEGFRGMEVVLGGNGTTREDQALLLAIIRTVASDSARQAEDGRHARVRR